MLSGSSPTADTPPRGRSHYEKCSNYADGLTGTHQAYDRECEGGLAPLADLQGDRRGSPLPEPLPLTPAPPQEGPGIRLPEALEPRLRPHTHNRRVRVHPDAGPQLHHHRHRLLAARRRVLTPCPPLRQRRRVDGKIRTVVERPVERLAHRVEVPDSPCFRRLAGIRSIQAVRLTPLLSRLAV